MSLVRVSEVEGEAGKVFRDAGSESLGGLDQSIALDDPLRRHADILAEKALQLTRSNRVFLHDLIDLRDAAVLRDASGDAALPAPWTR